MCSYTTTTLLLCVRFFWYRTQIIYKISKSPPISEFFFIFQLPLDFFLFSTQIVLSERERERETQKVRIFHKFLQKKYHKMASRGRYLEFCYSNPFIQKIRRRRETKRLHASQATILRSAARRFEWIVRESI